MVKLIVGNLEYEATRFSHRFYFNDNEGAEQINIELKHFSDSMASDLSENFEGSGQIISDDVTYSFEGYTLDSIDYSVDDKGERTSIFLRK